METGSDSVSCPRCGAENPARSKFCARCYGLLHGPICPHCGRRATRAGARFCEHCGGDLRAPPSPRLQIRQEPGPEVPAAPSQAAPTEPPPGPPTGSDAVRAVPSPGVSPAAPTAAAAPPAESPALPVSSAPIPLTAPALPPAASAKPQTAAPPGPPAKPAARAGQRPVAKRPAPPPPRQRFGLLTATAGLTVVVATAVLLGAMLRRADISGVIPAATTSAPQVTASPWQPAVTSTPSGAAALESPRISAPPSRGTLKIATRPPGAKVELDGIAVGVTPLTLTEVAPGRHTIKVSRAGFRSASREFDLVQGETLTVDLALFTPASPGTPRRGAPGAPPLPPPPLPPPPP